MKKNNYKFEITKFNYTFFNKESWIKIIIILVGVLLIVAKALGHPMIFSSRWDSGIFIDGVWRLTNDQVSSIDYSSPFGPLTFWVLNLGSRITCNYFEMFNYGMASASIFLLLIWLIYLIVNEARLNLYFLMLLSISFFTTSRVIGYPFYYLGFIGLYNNIGYSLLLLIIAEFIRKQETKSYFLNGILLGCISYLIVMTKITFGLVAIGILILMKKEKKDTIIIALLSLLLCIILQINFIWAYFYDILKLIKIKHLSSLQFNTQLFSYQNIIFFIWLFYILIIKKDQLFSFVNLIIIVLIVSIALTLTIDQPGELVLFAVLPIVLSSSAKFKFYGILKKCIIFFPFWFILMNNTLGNCISPILLLASNWSPSIGLFNYKYDATRRLLNDGSNQEIIKYLTQTPFLQKIVILNTNPISAICKKKPMPGTLLYWHEGITYSVKDPDTIIEIKKIFTYADAILLPKAYEHSNYEYFRDILKRNMYKDWEIIELDSWSVWKKNN